MLAYEDILRVIEEFGLESKSASVTQFCVKLEGGLTLTIDSTNFGEWFASVSYDTDKMLDVGRPIVQMLFWPNIIHVDDDLTLCDYLSNEIPFDTSAKKWLHLDGMLQLLKKTDGFRN